MKKLMCLLALAGLIVGCAHTHSAGGTSVQTETTTESNSGPPSTNNIYNSPSNGQE